MKLDRETEALIYWSSSSTATPLWELSPHQARAEYRRTLSKTEIAPAAIGEVKRSHRAGACRDDALTQIRPRRSGARGRSRHPLYARRRLRDRRSRDPRHLLPRAVPRHWRDRAFARLSARARAPLPRRGGGHRRGADLAIARGRGDSASMRSGSRLPATAQAAGSPPSRCTRPRARLRHRSARRL